MKNSIAIPGRVRAPGLAVAKEGKERRLQWGMGAIRVVFLSIQGKTIDGRPVFR